MGVLSWEGNSMEYLIFVYNIWNAVFGNKLAGLFIPRELCQWIRSLNTDICRLRTHFRVGYTSQGIYFILKTFQFHPSCTVLFLLLTIGIQWKKYADIFIIRLYMQKYPGPRLLGLMETLSKLGWIIYYAYRTF